MEVRAVNVCQSGPPPEYAEDSEEDETPLQICEVEYEQGDRLFMMRILLKPTAEDLCTTSMISQKLAEGARRASETWKGLLTLPNCAKGFESVFAKEDFDILLEHRQWDHAIKLIPGSEPKSSKVYSSGTKGVRLFPGREPAYQTNLPFQIPHGSPGILHQEKGRLTPVGSGLPSTQFHDGQE